MIAEPGWEEVADKALKWAEVNTKPVGTASNAEETSSFTPRSSRAA